MLEFSQVLILLKFFVALFNISYATTFFLNKVILCYVYVYILCSSGIILPSASVNPTCLNVHKMKKTIKTHKEDWSQMVSVITFHYFYNTRVDIHSTVHKYRVVWWIKESTLSVFINSRVERKSLKKKINFLLIILWWLCVCILILNS